MLAQKNTSALDADCLTNPAIAAIFAPLVPEAKQELQRPSPAFAGFCS
jgi:hypothetical protein